VFDGRQLLRVKTSVESYGSDKSILRVVTVASLQGREHESRGHWCRHSGLRKPSTCCSELENA
jgi:hypothetical protein